MQRYFLAMLLLAAASFAIDVSFVSPTPANNSTIYTDSIYINASVNGTGNLSAFIDFNRSLVGYWSFDSISGATVYDNSTYGNNGTNYGAANATGKFGNALGFDGVSNYVSVPSSQLWNLGANWSLETWVYPTSFKPLYNTIYSWVPGGWLQIFLDGAGNVKIASNSEGEQTYSGAAVQLNKWNHVQIVSSNRNTTVYINGVSAGSKTVTLPSGTAGLRLAWDGCTVSTCGNDRQLTGDMDEFRLWRRTLAPEEIGASYNASLYRLERNFANLALGDYSFYAYALDSSGSSNRTETRSVSIAQAIDVTPPEINFTAPTPPNNSCISAGYTQINLSITDPNLDAFRFNWNAANCSFRDPSLVLAMNFNNNSAIGENSAKAADISKYWNNGTIYGAVWNSSGRFGPALQFDGVDDYVDCGNAASLNLGDSDFTIEGWFRRKSLGTEQDLISKHYDVSGDKSNFEIYFGDPPTDNILKARWTYNSGVWKAGSFQAVTGADVWYHFVLVHSGPDMIFYFNGDYKTATSDGGTIDSVSYPLHFGRRGPPWAYFSGLMDEVRIYNRALSAEEIRVQYLSEFQKYNSTEWTFYDNLINLTDGTYAYYAWANDTAGNSNYTTGYPAESPRYLRIDTTAPALAIQNPANSTYGAAVALNFTVSDPNPNACWYDLDGANTSLPGCGNTSITAAAGGHTLTVLANDTLGFTNSSAVYFSVDATAPSLQVHSPANTTYGTNTISLNYTADATASNCWYSLDGGANTSLPGCGNTSLSSLSQGSHTLITYANDSAGNQNASTVYFSVAMTPPGIAIQSPANTTYGTSSMGLNFTVSDAGSGIDSCWYRLDAGANTSLPGCGNASMVGLSDGSHTISVYANDSAGNTGRAQASFSVSTPKTGMTLVIRNQGLRPLYLSGISLNGSYVSFDPPVFFATGERKQVTFSLAEAYCNRTAQLVEFKVVILYYQQGQISGMAQTGSVPLMAKCS